MARARSAPPPYRLECLRETRDLIRSNAEGLVVDVLAADSVHAAWRMWTLLIKRCELFRCTVGNFAELHAAGELREPLVDARFAVLTLIDRIRDDIDLTLGQGQGQGGPVPGALGNGGRAQGAGRPGPRRGAEAHSPAAGTRVGREAPSQARSATAATLRAREAWPEAGRGGAFARGGYAHGQGGPVPGALGNGGRAQGQRGLARGGRGGAFARGGYAHGQGGPVPGEHGVAVAYEAPVRSWLPPDFLRFRDGSCLVDPRGECSAMKDAELTLRDNDCDPLRERATTLAGHFKSVRRHVRAFDRELRKARALFGRRHNLEARLARLRALREMALPGLEGLLAHIDSFSGQRIVFPEPEPY